MFSQILRVTEILLVNSVYLMAIFLNRNYPINYEMAYGYLPSHTMDSGTP